jgi:hypothetical protein
MISDGGHIFLFTCEDQGGIILQKNEERGIGYGKHKNQISDAGGL